LLTPEELSALIEDCSLNKRESQKKLYNSFYGYAMAICDRYTSGQEEAMEILNDGFLKIFREIHHFKPAYSDTINSFKGWLKKIMIYTAIDYFRKYHKHKLPTPLESVVYQLPLAGETALDKISYEEIIHAIQGLSPGYRTVLNLFIVEGLTHEEISDKLGISIGTSKSNLFKARQHLQKTLLKNNEIKISTNAI
jgi:RNA polymerase sigma factor (sigma-70 family)